MYFGSESENFTSSFSFWIIANPAKFSFPMLKKVYSTDRRASCHLLLQHMYHTTRLTKMKKWNKTRFENVI